MKTLFIKALRDLKAQKWQFLAVSFLVFLGIALFSGLYSSYLNIEATYKKFYAQTNFEDIGVEFNPAPIDLLKKVKAIPGVKAVVGRLTAYATMEIEGREIQLKLVSIPEKNSKVDSIYLVEGVYPKRNEVLIVKKFADLNGISVGEVIHVRVNGKTYNLRISGTAYSPEYVLIAERRNILTSPKDFGIIFVPYRLMERITGLKGKITEVHLTVYYKDRIDEILNEVKKIFEPYGLKNFYKREDQPSYKLLRMDLEGFRHMALTFPSLLLFIAVLAIYILLSRIVMEQIGIIAVLRALGYSKRSVVIHYLMYSILIGFIGTSAGIIAGYYISAGMTSAYVDVLNLPYYVSKIYPNVLLSSILAGFLTPIIAGIFTAKRVAEIEPAIAMRGYTVKYRVIRFERYLARFSILTRLAIKNVFRNPKRTLYTLFGVAMGVVLIATSMAFIDSVDEMLHIQFEKIQTFDYKVECSNLMAVKSLKDVREAYPIIETWILIERNGLTKSSNLIGLPSNQDLYNIYDLNGKRHFPPPEGIILPKYIAENLSIAKGETIEAFTKLGRVKLKVYDIIPQPLMPVCYANLKELERLGFRPNEVIVKGGNENELKKFGTVVSMKRLRRVTEEMMSMMYDFFVFSVLFGASLAFAEIFNTTTINILERKREIATLRMLGYTVKEIAVSLFIETFLIGAFGLIIGFPMALMTLQGFKMTYKSEIFNMPFVMYPRTYVITTVIIIVTLAISLVPGIRYIAKMEIDKVTKEFTG